MTEPQHSPNERDSSSPQQTTDINLHALATQLVKELQALAGASGDIATTLSKLEQQRTKIDPVARLSLIISLLSFISTIILGTVGSLYLYTKQAETNIKFSLAHLALDVLPASTCPDNIPLACLAQLQVTNKGPAPATGITVDVFIKDVAPAWRAPIKDMNDFKITTLPSVVKVNQTLFYDPDPVALATVVKNNADELTITSLPPNNPGIKVTLGLSPRIPVVRETTSINTVLYVVSQEAQDVNFGNGFPTVQVMQKYFGQLLSIADFEVNATCQNCTNDPDPLVSSASSLVNDALSSSLNPQNLLNSIWAGSVSVTYERPQRWSLSLTGNSLNLWTEPDNPTAPLDSSTQTYLGIVTSCKPTGQSGGNQDTCIPTFVSTGN